MNRPALSTGVSAFVVLLFAMGLFAMGAGCQAASTAEPSDIGAAPGRADVAAITDKAARCHETYIEDARQLSTAELDGWSGCLERALREVSDSAQLEELLRFFNEGVESGAASLPLRSEGLLEVPEGGITKADFKSRLDRFIAAADAKCDELTAEMDDPGKGAARCRVVGRSFIAYELALHTENNWQRAKAALPAPKTTPVKKCLDEFDAATESGPETTGEMVMMQNKFNDCLSAANSQALSSAMCSTVAAIDAKLIDFRTSAVSKLCADMTVASETQDGTLSLLTYGGCRSDAALFTSFAVSFVLELGDG